MFKKLLSVVLTVLMILSVMTVSADEGDPSTTCDHSWTWVNNPEGGNEKGTCSLCQAETMREHSWVWDLETNEHKRICSNHCGVESTDSGSHTLNWVDVGGDTLQYCCTVCGYVSATHTHNWCYECNETSHRYICWNDSETCPTSAAKDSEAHSFEWKSTGSDQHAYQCITCNYIYSEHTNGYGADDGCALGCCTSGHSFGTWSEQSGSHVRTCSVCNYVESHDNGDGSGDGCTLDCCASGHILGDWSVQGGNHICVCQYCDYEVVHDNGYGAEDGCTLECCGGEHQYGDWRVDGDYHVRECSKCSYTESHANSEGSADGCTLECCSGKHNLTLVDEKDTIGDYQCQKIHTKSYRCSRNCGKTSTKSETTYEHEYDESKIYHDESGYYCECKYCKSKKYMDSSKPAIDSSLICVDGANENLSVKVEYVWLNGGASVLVMFTIVDDQGNAVDAHDANIVIKAGAFDKAATVYNIDTMASISSDMFKTTSNEDQIATLTVSCEEAGIYYATPQTDLVIPMDGHSKNLYIQFNTGDTETTKPEPDNSDRTTSGTDDTETTKPEPDSSDRTTSGTDNAGTTNSNSDTNRALESGDAEVDNKDNSSDTKDQPEEIHLMMYNMRDLESSYAVDVAGPDETNLFSSEAVVFSVDGTINGMIGMTFTNEEHDLSLVYIRANTEDTSSPDSFTDSGSLPASYYDKAEWHAFCLQYGLDEASVDEVLREQILAMGDTEAIVYLLNNGYI